MVERPACRSWVAARALARCAVRTAALVVQRRIHQPGRHVGRPLRFADGTTPTVYRETVVDRGPTVAPAVLVVGFRLRGAPGRRLHAAFRVESVLNTVLFAGFAGFVSKLWLAHDAHGVYRGVYEWDDPELAERYVRALWWPLALISVPSSIHHVVLPGLRRDDLLARPELAMSVAPNGGDEWWRLVETGDRAA